MRTLTSDQYEFAHEESEEHLEIALATGREPAAGSVAALVGVACIAHALQAIPVPVPFDETLGYGRVRSYLADFAGVLLPVPCAWPTTVLEDGPGDCELVVSAPDLLIYYHWSTLA